MFRYARTLQVLLGGIVGAALYFYYLVSGIHPSLPFIASLIAGFIGGFNSENYLRGVGRGLASSIVALLILYLYYLLSAFYATFKLTSLGLVGLLPVVFAAILGVLGGVIALSLRDIR